MKSLMILLTGMFFTHSSFATEFDGNIPEWNKKKESFKKPEETFKTVLQTLKEKYVDKEVSEEDLYRAATEGMLAALNPGKENWNTLLSPRQKEDVHIEMSGQLSGIGVTMDFDKSTGYAKVRNLIPGSASVKAGLQKGDLILSVNGKRYTDLRDMTMDIRGKTGEKVKLKILRQDRVLDVAITRAPVIIPMAQAALLDDKTGYLMIDTFANPTLKDVTDSMQIFKGKKLSKLILDLRSNLGGLFEKSLEVADIFLKSGETIVRTKSRDGSIKEYKAKNEAWSPETKIVILTSVETASSAEILTAALKDNRHAIVVGSKTMGKWTVESFEDLANGYAMKYSVKTFESPAGKAYQSTGITPDFEINMNLSEGEMIEMHDVSNMKQRLTKDAVLRAAAELK